MSHLSPETALNHVLVIPVEIPGSVRHEIEAGRLYTNSIVAQEIFHNSSRIAQIDGELRKMGREMIDSHSGGLLPNSEYKEGVRARRILKRNLTSIRREAGIYTPLEKLAGRVEEFLIFR